MSLTSEARVKGVLRVLSLGLRVLCLLEYQVRSQLAQQRQVLAGLSAGNPTRATPRPTSEAVLKALNRRTRSPTSPPFQPSAAHLGFAPLPINAVFHARSPFSRTDFHIERTMSN